MPLTAVQIDYVTTEQAAAVAAFIRGEDVLVCLPSSSGKSLCYACLPYVLTSFEIGSQKDNIVL